MLNLKHNKRKLTNLRKISKESILEQKQFYYESLPPRRLQRVSNVLVNSPIVTHVLPKILYLSHVIPKRRGGCGSLVLAVWVVPPLSVKCAGTAWTDPPGEEAIPSGRSV